MDLALVRRRGPWWALVCGVLLAHLALLGGWSLTSLGGAGPAPLPAPVQVHWLSPAPALSPPATSTPMRRSRPQALPTPMAETAAAPAPSEVPPEPAAPVALAEAPQAPASAPSEDPPATAASVSPPVAAPVPSVSDFQWPPMSPEHWPAPVALNYRLTGQDKGLNYMAQGQLRWQHNGQDYALSLTVRAFLLGSREWRSVGQIGPQGLQPRRFSDHGRQERAAHFDQAQSQLILSGSTTPVPLAPGAQDQLSLYVQLAAAMRAAPQAVQGASPFRVHTATARNLVPWVLTHQGQETLEHEGRRWLVQRWLCEPQSRWDARLELWSAPELEGLPLRIRITQVSGSFIDLWWQSSAPLPAWTPNS